MLPEIELLQYIHKTAEMGCQGILTVLDHTKNTSLHQVLEEQRAEYQKLGREAERLLSARGEDATKLGAMAKISSELMAKMCIRDRHMVRLFPGSAAYQQTEY